MFSKKGAGGEVISDLKNLIAKMVLVQPVCGTNQNIFSKKGAGGGLWLASKAVRKFSENSSVLESLWIGYDIEH